MSINKGETKRGSCSKRLVVIIDAPAIHQRGDGVARSELDRCVSDRSSIVDVNERDNTDSIYRVGQGPAAAIIAKD